MRLRIAHRTVYRYDPPAAGMIQLLRLTPRNHEGQYVIGWRIDVSGDARLNTHEDAFGNLTHVFSADGPFGEFVVNVDGEVETQDTEGIVRGTVERFPPSLFLRDTTLTQADARIRDFAQTIRAADGGDVLGELHTLLNRLHDGMRGESDPLQTEAATAAEVFARKRGIARDLTHIFIGAAHSLGIPARYVAGYVRPEGAVEQHAGHAWAEAFVPKLGWVGFDAANCVCPTEAYVRVAVGLDALGAIPVRGMRYGVGGETLAVAIKVDQ
ncbi:MAG: transglutaminase family protein [Xanthobacteraceae bacterium]|nr:transglutaminase family protein [Xanthobacteraceae bacterium]